MRISDSKIGRRSSRATAGKSDLSEAETELAGRVAELQLAREQAQAFSGRARPAARGVCPFKGLASFEPADAEYFFGRERLVAELVARLVGAGFLAYAVAVFATGALDGKQLKRFLTRRTPPPGPT